MASSLCFKVIYYIVNNKLITSESFYDIEKEAKELGATVCYLAHNTVAIYCNGDQT